MLKHPHYIFVQFQSTRKVLIRPAWVNEARSKVARCSGMKEMKDRDQNADLALKWRIQNVTHAIANDKSWYDDTDQSEAPSPWSWRSGLFTWVTPGLARLSGQFLTPCSRSSQCHWSHSRDIIPDHVWRGIRRGGVCVSNMLSLL